jgi:hypothetical protein
MPDKLRMRQNSGLLDCSNGSLLKHYCHFCCSSANTMDDGFVSTNEGWVNLALKKIKEHNV